MKRNKINLATAMRALEAQGWLSQCSKATRDLVGEVAVLRHYDKHQWVFLAGDDPNGIYGLVSGALQITYPRADRTHFQAYRAGTGFWFGAISSLAGKARLVSVQTVEPAVLVHLPDQDILRLAREDPRLYNEFYLIGNDNYTIALRVIANLALTSTEHRLADRLLLDLEAHEDAEGWISVSQSELAKLLAVSLPTLRRVMRRFVDAGILHCSYGRIRVANRPALVQIGTGDSGVLRQAPRR